MRIDRLLCELNIGSRSRVKELLKKGMILADGEKVTKPDTRVDELTTVITFEGREYRYRPFVYFMMNKPAGVVSATTDERERTVLDVFVQKSRELYGDKASELPVKELFPVGRLDKDTVGLLLLTNDGALAHELLSPRKHVPKSYYVKTDLPLTEEARLCLEKGVSIGEKELTRQAQVEMLEECQCRITITEGKYHQVKRMFQAVGLTVVYLKRLTMGSLSLDDTLPEGGIRELTQEEVTKLC